MESKDPTVFTKTYEEGVERVLKVIEQDSDLEMNMWIYGPYNMTLRLNYMAG